MTKISQHDCQGIYTDGKKRRRVDRRGFVVVVVVIIVLG